REDKRIEQAQQWTQKDINEAKEAIKAATITKNAEAEAEARERKERLDHRFAKLAQQRLPHLERLHADKGLARDDIIRLAYEVADYKRSPQTEQAIRTQRTEATEAHRDDVRMIRELAEELCTVGMTLKESVAEIMK